MLTGAGWQNCGAPGNGGCQGRYLYLSGGLDWLVGAWVECLFLVYFEMWYPLQSHCHLFIVVSQTATLSKPNCFSSVEIRSSRSYVHKRWWLIHFPLNWRFGMKQSIVGNIDGGSDSQWNEGLICVFYLSWTLVLHHTFDPAKPSWEQEIIITHILPIFVTCSNSYCRNLDKCSPLFSSEP